MAVSPAGAGPSESHEPRAQPTAPSQREPILDALRGFAMLGILLINVEYMRGTDFYATFLSETPATSLADEVVQFLFGWLAAGKFVSSFAILFGVGAALITRRALAAGRAPRGLLARRYGVLIGFGLAHMVLLFPGDILFTYGIAGLALIAFVNVSARTALRWSAGLIAGTTLAFIGLVGLMAVAPEPPADDLAAVTVTDVVADLRDEAVAAHTTGSYLDVVAVNVGESQIMQSGQLLVIPWVLGAFLLGMAVVRAGVLDDLAGHRRLLRRVMVVGLGVGLPANLTLGFVGPLAMSAAFQSGEGVGTGVAAVVGQMLAAPILAAGYLAAVCLLSLRLGVPRRLAAVGRMALSAYFAQSVLALAVFAGFGLYGKLGSAQALLFVVAVWAVLLVACPLWMARFRFGPAEWLWRTLVYGQRQPMRT